MELDVWVLPSEIDCFIASVTKDFFLPIYRRRKKEKLLINDMTFYQRGSHSIFSVDDKKGSILRGILCAGGAEPAGRFWGRRAAEVGPRVPGAGPALPAWMQPSAQPGAERGAASDSHRPGQMQLVPLEAGQGEWW